jgi:hypothetical protein
MLGSFTFELGMIQRIPPPRKLIKRGLQMGLGKAKRHKEGGRGKQETY